MSDRRVVDELSIEELEQILIVKRREARAERVRRLRESGHLPADGGLPHEDLSTIALADPDGGSATLELAVPRRRTFDLEPLGKKGPRLSGRRRKLPRAERSRWGRLRDRLLLVLEVGALLGLVAVVVASLTNLRALNDDYAQADLLPSPTPTTLAGGSVPGEHAPPEKPGSVPAHLRDLVGGETLPAIAIPTPGPQAPTRVVIPAINVDALIVEGDTPVQLKLGVGHFLASPNPGERGNMVLSAHNDVYGAIFRRLSDLELGDRVIVYAGEQPYRYAVTAKQIVERYKVSVLAPTTKPVVTLISCYPYMVDTHRVVVVAELQ